MSLPPFLVGDQVYLRALADSDASGPYLEWFNDAEVCKGNAHHVFPHTEQNILDYIHNASHAKSALILAIIEKSSDRHIGNIALFGINNVYRSTDFSIVIGDRGVWGKGLGKEAALLLCGHGFRELNLNRIACGTFSSNVAMQRLALWLGMKEEGLRRQAAYKGGKWLDVIEYGVLREEFDEKHGA